MTKPKVYFLFSAGTLTAGFVLYFFFRSGPMLIHQWLGFLPRNNAVIPFSRPSFLADFLRFNLPDGLWLLSGLLFLRALWHEQPKTFYIYRLCFLCIAFLLEALQVFDGIPGTFDIFDVVTMVAIALVESVIHKIPAMDAKLDPQNTDKTGKVWQCVPVKTGGVASPTGWRVRLRSRCPVFAIQHANDSYLTACCCPVLRTGQHVMQLRRCLFPLVCSSGESHNVFPVPPRPSLPTLYGKLWGKFSMDGGILRLKIIRHLCRRKRKE